MRRIYTSEFDVHSSPAEWLRSHLDRRERRTARRRRHCYRRTPPRDRQALDRIERAVARLGRDKVLVAPSCSLIHTPVDLSAEQQLDPMIANWLAFATQKLGEIATLAKGASRGRDAIEVELNASDAVRRHRETSPRIHNSNVQRRLSSITPDMKQRHSSYVERHKVQAERFKLPSLPTTAIGSFPQTAEIRQARAAFKSGQLSADQHKQAMPKEIRIVVDYQHRVGLDVLVHGEAERNDMVEYFIRDEVADLERAGIKMIQIDEAALREGLPLRRTDWQAYLDNAVEDFRIASCTVDDRTQIHTHMCYSEFNDIMPSIAAMDADVISIETSRSQMELLGAFVDFRYPNEIGPGVYDIHSPRVPTVEEMAALLRKAREVFASEQLWVNPDCGLKTRGWPEVEQALINMVAAAQQVRQELPNAA